MSSEKNTYSCAKCGNSFESEHAAMCGLSDIREYKEGTPVPDIGLFVCDECAEQIRNGRGARI